MSLIEMNALAAELERFDVALPARALAALEVLREAQRVAAEAPTDDVRAALLAGDLTPDNAASAVMAAAGKLAAQQYARQVARDLEYPAQSVFRDAVRADAPELLIALRPAFDAAAAGVLAAAELFPSDATPAEVLARGCVDS
jgi:hypothetical protein